MSGAPPRPGPRPPGGRCVVLLGGNGFLGTHIAAAFTRTGARVVTVSRTGQVPLDLTSCGPGPLVRLLAGTGADTVVNAAGRAWRATDQEMLRGNAELVTTVVRALSALPRPPRLVQLGTVHEYGPGVVGRGTREDHATAPVTAYGRTKLLGSRAVLEAARGGGLDGVVLRVANVCGPGAPRGSLLGAVAAHLAGVVRDVRAGAAPAALRLAPLRAARDVVDVRDVADAVVAAAAVPEAAGEVVNIGRGEAVVMRRLTDRLVELCGVPVPVVEEEPAGPARTDVEWQRLDVARARRLLGWRARRGLDASLRDLLAAELAAPA